MVFGVLHDRNNTYRISRLGDKKSDTVEEEDLVRTSAGQFTEKVSRTRKRRLPLMWTLGPLACIAVVCRTKLRLLRLAYRWVRTSFCLTIFHLMAEIPERNNLTIDIF